MIAIGNARTDLFVFPQWASVLILALWPGLPPALAEGSRPAGEATRLKPTTRDAAGKWAWYDARDLDVEGRGWKDTEQFFHRFPARAKGKVRDGVWGLSTHSAGMCVRFATDADKIAARWTVTSRNLAMDHMPATGVSGVDLYVKDGQQWRWIGVGRPHKSPTNEATLAGGIPKGNHEFMLYLPLYNGVESLLIGVPPEATLSKAPPRPTDRARPIVYYGTSIAQGGCANRPGMAHTSILGRRLDWHVINLGFSGNGTMDPEVGTLMAELDAAMYVIDCAPNMSAETISQRAEPFVTSLRKARPNTPIVLVENIVYQSGYFLPGSRESYESKNRALRKAYDALIAKGVADLHYVPCDNLLGTDGEATVDGAHCTDLGFQRFADALEPVLRRILSAPPVASTATSCGTPGSRPNPQAVADVKSGKRSVANAAWWGFDPQDATRFLQGAVDSGAKTVVVPYMGTEWVVTPIRLRSNLELIFEPGVVVLARKGAFRGRGDSLFSAADAGNLALRGYGATLRMHKKDYQAAPYTKAEWRMVLDLQGCRRVRIEGLRLESSGGDGIYLGATSRLPYCEDVVIRDVVCHDHHRQGISVIGAVNLLIENCVLSNTGGTAPQAGIDFEPNGPREKLIHCVVRNCRMENNAGAGVLIYLKQLSSRTDPVSILIEDCHIRSGRDVGIGVGAVTDDGPLGLIEFRNCTIENTTRGGLFLYDKSADKARVRFVNCRWSNVGKPNQEPTTRRAGKRPGIPLHMTLMRPKLVRRLGGVDFIDCRVYDDVDRPVLVADDLGSQLGIRDLKGRITVHNPHGARMDIRGNPSDVELRVVEAVP
jgi:lysophospholipase L1-like esterase